MTVQFHILSAEHYSFSLPRALYFLIGGKLPCDVVLVFAR